MTFHKDLALSRDGDLLTPHQHHVFPFAFARFFGGYLERSNTAQEISGWPILCRSFGMDFVHGVSRHSLDRHVWRVVRPDGAMVGTYCLDVVMFHITFLHYFFSDLRLL